MRMCASNSRPKRERVDTRRPRRLLDAAKAHGRRGGPSYQRLIYQVREAAVQPGKRP
jgi:predicted DNA binding CopG/RHH family protein